MNDAAPSSDETSDSPEPATTTSKRSRRRMWILIGCVVTVLAVAAGTAVALSVGSEGKPKPNESTGVPERCMEPTKKTGVTEPEDAPEDGGVEVVETGSSTSEELNELGEDNGQAGFGAVLENTSELAARNVEVTLAPSWQDGTPVQSHTGNTRPQRFGPWKIASLAPGQKLGLGTIIFIKNERQADNPELKLDVKATVEEWWEPDNDAHEFASITAEFDGAASSGRFEFAVDSKFCEDVRQARVSQVYRNSGGDIVGGWANLTVSRPSDDAISGHAELGEYSPGRTVDLSADNMWSDQTYTSGGYEEVADLSKTDIYPYFNPSAKN